MPVEIIARFLEHQVFPDRTTGRTPGYKAAIIETNEGPKFTHFIDVEALRRGQDVVFIRFETRVVIGEDPIDVSHLLNQNTQGAEWLRTLKGRYKTFLPEISLRPLSFVPLRYTIYPYDLLDEYFRSAPDGILRTLPPKTKYVEALPCVRGRDGEWLKPLYYKRMVTTARGKNESYSIKELGDCFLQARGVLLGEVDAGDVEVLTSFDSNDFPLRHYLQISYPVAIRDAHNVNPLSLEIQLA